MLVGFLAEAMIELAGVSKRYGAIPAVAEATLAVARGEFLALLGPSGSGKTTLLRLVAGFEVPDAGEIRVDGEPVADARACPSGAPARRDGVPGLCGSSRT